MALFSKFRKGSKGNPSGSLDRSANKADFEHLVAFIKSRPGVEAYVEPRTNVTEMTVVLVASTGEWTRRRISGGDTARDLGKKLDIPVYDVQLTGYPQRMRDWSSKHKS